MKKKQGNPPSPVPHSPLHTLFPPSMAPRSACSELPRYRVMISAVYKELIQSDSTESPGVLPLLWATSDDRVVACNGCLSLPGFVLCCPRSERNAPLQQLTPASTCCFCLLPAAGRQGKKSVWSLSFREPIFAVSSSRTKGSFQDRKKPHRQI